MYKRFSGGKIQTPYIRNNMFTKKGKISKIQTSHIRNNMFTKKGKISKIQRPYILKIKGKSYTSKNKRRKSKDKEFSKEYIEQLIQRYYELDEELSPKK